MEIAASSGRPKESVPRVSTRAAEDDERVDSLRAAVGGDLVTEHPTLGVAADVDLVSAGLLADAVDRLVDCDHVVIERTLETSLLPLRRTEIDDPGVDAVAVEDVDGAG